MIDGDTVDGSEFLRSTVEVGSLSHHLRWVLYMPSGAGCLPSTVGKGMNLESYDLQNWNQVINL